MDIEYCNSKYDAIKDVDALIMLTGLDEFKNIDLREMKKRMGRKVIFDMRNVIPDNIQKEGFKVYKINVETI